MNKNKKNNQMEKQILQKILNSELGNKSPDGFKSK